LPAVIPVDGTVDNTVIVNTFANYFASNSSPFNDCLNDAFKLQYQGLEEQYTASPIVHRNLFDVELISNVINKMDYGKAGRLDDLTSELLKFSQPIVVCIFTKLFNLFTRNGPIPKSFGESYTLSIPKCEGRLHLLSHDDFRDISISCVISKLFEIAIIDRYQVTLLHLITSLNFKRILAVETLFTLLEMS